MGECERVETGVVYMFVCIVLLDDVISEARHDGEPGLEADVDLW